MPLIMHYFVFFPPIFDLMTSRPLDYFCLKFCKLFLIFCETFLCSEVAKMPKLQTGKTRISKHGTPMFWHARYFPGVFLCTLLTSIIYTKKAFIWLKSLWAESFVIIQYNSNFLGIPVMYILFLISKLAAEIFKSLPKLLFQAVFCI